MRALRQRVLAYDVHRWATSFIETLQRVSGKSKGGARLLASPSILSALVGRVRTAIETLQHVSDKGTGGQPLSSPSEISTLIGRVRKAEKVLLILDYDGTLVPFADVPEEAVPDSELLELLKALAARRGTSVHVVSGRTRDSVERWFGDLPIGLHAEHGFWSRPHSGSLWLPLRDVSVEWKEKVRPILEQFMAMTPGAFIEDKTTATAWHYRMVEADFGELQAKELRLHLAELLSNVPVEVLVGDKVVEVRLHGVHKGVIVPSLLAEHGSAVTVLAMGDDRTDEDLFAALPPNSFTVHVGLGPSRAQYRLADPTAARKLLHAILDQFAV
jgi:trehalose 6-phosphate synthase/phosphatase